MIEYKNSKDLVNYEKSLNYMHTRLKDICNNKQSELYWELEHQEVYTIGRSGNKDDILQKTNIPIINTNRGGRVTYHGPGQLVVYIMLNLNYRNIDIRCFLNLIEQWLLSCLNKIGISAFMHKQFTGIWSMENGQEKKIASIGIRVANWITLHGIALNVNNDLSKFNNILPCGLLSTQITSLSKVRQDVDMQMVKNLLKNCFDETFEQTRKIVKVEQTVEVN